MKLHKYTWIIGLLVTLALIILPLILLLPRRARASGDPWANLPQRKPHTDHSNLMTGPYKSGPEVTLRCLECHADAGSEMLASVHWTWLADPVEVAGRAEPVELGKRNAINNFCIGIQSNWAGCTSCHAGYGWDDADFDFGQQQNIDCLVCHDNSGTYGKGAAGLPLDGVDLVYAAQSVGVPDRSNCGGCHFEGGGGNAVKHGDLDDHLINPADDFDVHMGKYNFICIDCHQSENHQIRGRSISVSLELSNQVNCTDCHAQQGHADQRLNAHTTSVACQTCHIPHSATKDATKMYWDWSTAGQDREESVHSYLKIKGSFVYQGDFIPEYYWFSGVADRYLFGDVINPDEVTSINTLAGRLNDPAALIMPFKVHRARQPYDTVYNYLLQPQTYGEEGFWTKFDWDDALRHGSAMVGLDYSGSYGFAETEMFWPITHTVAPAAEALGCPDCHGPNGRLDWIALGYFGDPMQWGGRVLPVHISSIEGK